MRAALGGTYWDGNVRLLVATAGKLFVFVRGAGADVPLDGAGLYLALKAIETATFLTSKDTLLMLLVMAARKECVKLAGPGDRRGREGLPGSRYAATAVYQAGEDQ